MRQRTNVGVWTISTLILAAAAIAIPVVGNATAQMKTKELVRYKGKTELIRPDGYREWIYIGTPLTPNDMNGGKAPFPEFHNTYIDPVSWEHWKRTGEFRNGTIIIKELVDVRPEKAAASGKGYFMKDFIGLEASVKDSKRFPDEPGNWAYFSFTTPDHESLAGTAKPFPTATCASCHLTAPTDMVFTQYYPVLSAERKQSATQ